MSNFTFLTTEWLDLHESAAKVESLARTDARSCCFYGRRTLELAVYWLYEHDTSLKKPSDDNLSALIYEPTFKQNLPGELFLKVKTIKEVGNLAVHSLKPITERDALRATKELFHFLYWLARTYTRDSAAQYENIAWDEQKVAARQVSASVKTLDQLKALEEQLRERDREIAEKAKALADIDTQLALLREQIAEAKKENELIPDDHDYSEAETRDYFIDLMLREAGWPLENVEDREYPVTGMLNGKGDGFVDYVLWGNDGLPLAVVEAKSTKKDPRIGQQQAKLYADCLEKQFNQRPLIGRGTRLRPDLFGPGADKGFFYIFDFCQNLEFFNQDAKGVEGSAQESLTTKPFAHESDCSRSFDTLLVRMNRSANWTTTSPTP